MRKQQLLLLAFVACTTVSVARDDNWDVYMVQYEKGERTDYFYISDTTTIRKLLAGAFGKRYPQYKFII